MANGTIRVSQIDVLTTSGTGTLSIVPPATNTNRTLTLPDLDGTLINVAPGTNGNVLTSNGSAWVSQAAGGGFAAGTVMLFGQTAAPTGWTKDASNYNNSALRVVTGTASTGGTVDFTTAFASGLSADATTLTTSTIPSHTHTVSSRFSSGGDPVLGPSGDQNSQAFSVNTGSTGSGGSHTHTLPSFAVKYVDVIRATKN